MNSPAADAERPTLALGVLAVPLDRPTRAAIRASWLQDRAIATGAAVVRFVIGAARPCARKSCEAEASRHADIAFVNASDCAPWHASHKVHAWYRYALVHFDNARWYGKVEDDAMVSVSNVLADLELLGRHTQVDYYGHAMQWIAHCKVELPGAGGPVSAGWAARSCAQGCWLGRVSGSIAAGRPGVPSKCERGFDGKAIVPGSDVCASLPYGVFAPGPLEVRSARLATRVSFHCKYADAYFSTLVARGALISDECASTDGAQGHAIGACVASGGAGGLLVADAGGERQAYPSRATAALLQAAAVNDSTTMATRRVSRGAAYGYAHARAALPVPSQRQRRWAQGEQAPQQQPPPPQQQRRLRQQQMLANALAVLHPIKPGPTSTAAWRSFWAMLNARAPRAELASARLPPISLVRVEWHGEAALVRPSATRVGILGT